MQLLEICQALSLQKRDFYPVIPIFQDISLHFLTYNRGLGAPIITGTIADIPSTISLTTDSASAGPGLAYASSWIAADVVNVLYLVYAPSDNATAGSGASGQTSTGTATKTNLPTIVMLLTIGVAFGLGFMMLVPI